MNNGNQRGRGTYRHYSVHFAFSIPSLIPIVWVRLPRVPPPWITPSIVAVSVSVPGCLTWGYQGHPLGVSMAWNSWYIESHPAQLGHQWLSSRTPMNMGTVQCMNNYQQSVEETWISIHHKMHIGHKVSTMAAVASNSWACNGRVEASNCQCMFVVTSKINHENCWKAQWLLTPTFCSFWEAQQG